MVEEKLISLLKQFNNLRKQRPFYPSHARIILSDLVRVSYLRSKDVSKFIGDDCSQNQNSIHLQAAMKWLCFAQDINNDGGVATSYSFSRGWMASYPETTGYIIPTFFDYYYFTGLEEYQKRALKMADWLVSIQLSNGAFQGGPVDILPMPSVFNTGQIILGLVRAFEETKDERYLSSAIMSGNWLVEVQDEDGAWRKSSYNNIAHSYYTRVAWSLLEIYQLTREESYKQAAVKNLEWALSNQKENGWFENNSFDLKINPFTHNIVYVAEGFLDSGIILNETKYIESANRIAESLLIKFEINKFLHGDYDENWNSLSSYSCLTGNAQLSGVLMRLYKLNGNKRYLNAAVGINKYLKSTQILNSRNLGILGGIKGSDPVWGKYMQYSYPNWAVKFFVDALILEEEIKDGLE